MSLDDVALRRIFSSDDKAGKSGGSGGVVGDTRRLVNLIKLVVASEGSVLRMSGWFRQQFLDYCL